MIIIAAFILGALVGTLTAMRRKGKLLDILQYAAGYGIAFCVIGLFATIFIDRIAR